MFWIRHPTGTGFFEGSSSVEQSHRTIDHSYFEIFWVWKCGPCPTDVNVQTFPSVGATNLNFGEWNPTFSCVDCSIPIWWTCNCPSPVLLTHISWYFLTEITLKCSILLCLVSEIHFFWLLSPPNWYPFLVLGSNDLFKTDISFGDISSLVLVVAGPPPNFGTSWLWSQASTGDPDPVCPGPSVWGPNDDELRATSHGWSDNL